MKAASILLALLATGCKLESGYWDRIRISQKNYSVVVSARNVVLVKGSWEDYSASLDREIVVVRVPENALPPDHLDVYREILDANVGFCRAELLVPRDVELVGSKFINIRLRKR